MRDDHGRDPMSVIAYANLSLAAARESTGELHGSLDKAQQEIANLAARA